MDLSNELGRVINRAVLAPVVVNVQRRQCVTVISSFFYQNFVLFIIRFRLDLLSNVTELVARHCREIVS